MFLTIILIFFSAETSTNRRAKNPIDQYKAFVKCGINNKKIILRKFVVERGNEFFSHCGQTNEKVLQADGNPDLQIDSGRKEEAGASLKKD